MPRTMLDIWYGRGPKVPAWLRVLVEYIVDIAIQLDQWKVDHDRGDRRL